ncbi:MAG: MATE family efflux transporter, partial [Spirochaetes bacterium]|nr:MATE family efflux transporter [Spirochaetota bacterium]
KRILKFGLPNGIHFFLDMLGFTLFLLIVGKLGTNELAATNIAFNISSLAFLPMIGAGIAVSMLVGQNIGKNDIKMAERCVFSGFQMTFCYMALFSLVFFLFPEVFIYPFAVNADSELFAPIYKISLVLLRFVAIYCMFDTLNIIFASAIKGAGDTRFVMNLSVFLSLGLLVTPTFLAITVFRANVYVAWVICTIYIITLGMVFLSRYLVGKWKKMKVIETEEKSHLNDEI